MSKEIISGVVKVNADLTVKLPYQLAQAVKIRPNTFTKVVANVSTGELIFKGTKTSILQVVPSDMVVDLLRFIQTGSLLDYFIADENDVLYGSQDGVLTAGRTTNLTPSRYIGEDITVFGSPQERIIAGEKVFLRGHAPVKISNETDESSVIGTVFSVSKSRYTISPNEIREGLILLSTNLSSKLAGILYPEERFESDKEFEKLISGDD